MPIRDIDPDPRGACTAHAWGPVKRGVVKEGVPIIGCLLA